MQKNKIMVFLLSALLLMTLAAAGCVEEGQEPVSNNDLENNLEENETENETEKEISLYFMEDTGTSFEIGRETREFANLTAENVMNELLEGPETDELSRAVPEDTELLAIKVEDKIAYVDLSSHPVGSYGHETEQVAVYSIVNTLAQLDEVDAVQLLIEGEIMDTLSGHEPIGEPLTPLN